MLSASLNKIFPSFHIYPSSSLANSLSASLYPLYPYPRVFPFSVLSSLAPTLYFACASLSSLYLPLRLFLGVSTHSLLPSAHVSISLSAPPTSPLSPTASLFPYCLPFHPSHSLLTLRLTLNNYSLFNDFVMILN